jgi:uncharacterized phiE125 gp8 family phage protein
MLYLISSEDTSATLIDDAKQHCRITHNEEDNLLYSYIRCAVAFCETRTNYDLTPKIYEEQFERFPSYPGGKLTLERGLVSELVSFKYYDPQHELQDFEDYQFASPFQCRGFIWKLPSVSWPSTACRLDAVQIRYRTGDDIPEQAHHAILMLVDDLYKNRADTSEVQSYAVKNGVAALLAQIALRIYA